MSEHANDYTLEKLRINDRLGKVENTLDTMQKLMEADRDDRKNFRNEIKEMYARHNNIIFGDGEARKGFATRMDKLESAHATHAKVVWTAITATMGIAVTGFWNFITGHKTH